MFLDSQRKLSAPVSHNQRIAAEPLQPSQTMKKEPT